jgi:Transposase DDE domain group 1
MRVIVRRERPHPGAQLRITDVNGHRITAFATNTPRGQLADLELRHRRRARCEDRIRIAKDTGLTNLPLHDLDQNRIWCAGLAGLRAHRLDANARLPRPSSPSLGTQTAAATPVLSARQHRRPRPPEPAAPTPPASLDSADTPRPEAARRPARTHLTRRPPHHPRTPGTAGWNRRTRRHPATPGDTGRHRANCHTLMSKSARRTSRHHQTRSPGKITKDRG